MIDFHVKKHGPRLQLQTGAVSFGSIQFITASSPARFSSSNYSGSSAAAFRQKNRHEMASKFFTVTRVWFAGKSSVLGRKTFGTDAAPRRESLCADAQLLG